MVTPEQRSWIQRTFNKFTSRAHTSLERAALNYDLTGSRTTQEFVEAVIAKGVPIDPEDAQNFALAVKELHPPSNFLKIVAASMDFYDYESFQQDLMIAIEKVKELFD